MKQVILITGPQGSGKTALLSSIISKKRTVYYNNIDDINFVSKKIRFIVVDPIEDFDEFVKLSLFGTFVVKTPFDETEEEIELGNITLIGLINITISSSIIKKIPREWNIYRVERILTNR